MKDKDILDILINNTDRLTESEIKAIENLIKRNKELEEENIELKNKSDENLAYYDQIYKNGIYTGQKAVEEKIKEKIEELNKERKKQDEEDTINVFYDQIDITHMIEVLQELLEES
jgi:hypothetical protein